MNLLYTSKKVTFIVVTQHDIYALDSCDIIRFELCIATRNSDYGIRVATVDFTYDIATFFVGVLRYRTAIYHRHICRFRGLNTEVTATLKFACQG